MSDKKIRAAVLFGGQSSEYSVSLHSASSALRCMPEELDLVLVGITERGSWYLYEGPVDAIEQDRWQKEKVTPCTLSLDPGDHGFLVKRDGRAEVVRVDVVFPILHGIHGEDGTVQAACELAGIPVVGPGMTSSALCMDKEYTHEVADHAGVKMAEWEVLRRADAGEGFDRKAYYEHLAKKLGLPFVVKPCNAGSSYGVMKVHGEQEFAPALEAAFRYDPHKILFEQFMTGFEAGVAVLGNDRLIMGEPDEIVLGKTEIFNFTEKYNLITSRIIVPARVSPEVKEKLYDLAGKMYQAMDCRGMARVDCWVCGEEVYLNELNSIPGFTSASRYPQMMRAKGYEFTDVLRKLVHLALQEER